MEEKEPKLWEILKGHEGETFYSESLGYVELHQLESTSVILIVNKHKRIAFKCALIDAEDDLFPSKDQRDWTKWDKENNKEAPKTWSELIKDNEILLMGSATSNPMYSETDSGTAIEIAASALLKIHQLIEVGYGGNITNEEWNNAKTKYIIDGVVNKLNISDLSATRCHLAFHTREQAKEFLSYPENVQLLKDYFMIE